MHGPNGIDAAHGRQAAQSLGGLQQLGRIGSPPRRVTRRGNRGFGGGNCSFELWGH